ncbi:MAG: hypothetical protein AAGK04_10465 [Planctomycetota bacterium]
MRRSSKASVLLVCVLAVVAVGCQGRKAAVTYARPYPQLEPIETLDVQVIKTETHVELTNTTGRDFGFSNLWINQRFNRPITGFEIGQTLKLPLKEFVDQHSDRFPAGGFFATGPADNVVLAEIETLDEAGESSELYGLIVVTDVEAE